MGERLTGPACVVVSCVSLQTGAALATTVFAAFGPPGPARCASPPQRSCWSPSRGRGYAGGRRRVARDRGARRGDRGDERAALRGDRADPARDRRDARLPRAARAGARRHAPAARPALGVGAAAGVVLITGGPSGAVNAGVGFAVGAAVCVAVSVLAARRVGTRTEGLDGLALSIAGAALLTAPVGVPAALGHPDPAALAVIAGVGVLGVVVPYALELEALRRVGVTTYSVLMSLDPAIAGLVGLVLLGQHLDAEVLAGIGLVIGASAGAVASARRLAGDAHRGADHAGGEVRVHVGDLVDGEVAVRVVPGVRGAAQGHERERGHAHVVEVERAVCGHRPSGSRAARRGTCA